MLWRARHGSSSSSRYRRYLFQETLDLPAEAPQGGPVHGEGIEVCVDDKTNHAATIVGRVQGRRGRDDLEIVRDEWIGHCNLQRQYLD
jgi:uncharacterized protein YlxW (UPF0749 family)